MLLIIHALTNKYGECTYLLFFSLLNIASKELDGYCVITLVQ